MTTLTHHNHKPTRRLVAAAAPGRAQRMDEGSVTELVRELLRDARGADGPENTGDQARGAARTGGRFTRVPAALQRAEEQQAAGEGALAPAA